MSIYDKSRAFSLKAFYNAEMKVMRAGPQLGVAKAARAPPCTLPILGRRFILTTLYYNP